MDRTRYSARRPGWRHVGWWGLWLMCAGFFACAPRVTTAEPREPVVPTAAVQIAEPEPEPEVVAEDPPEPFAQSSEIPIHREDASRGAVSAPVTIVAFMDLECPFCGRAAPTLDRLQDSYGEDQLRIVYKHMPLPFHRRAKRAAYAAMAKQRMSGDAAFFEYARMLYQELRGYDERKMRELDAGVRAARRSARFSLSVEQQLQRDVALAEELGVRGTPAFFVNGVKISGAQPDEKFREVIDAELDAVHRARDKGLPAEATYATRVAKNFENPPPERATPKPEVPDDTTVWKVPLGKAPVQGPADALVTIVEFSDFQCPFCNRVNPTLEKLRAAYPRDIRIAFKHNPLPFHKNADPAAQVAIEAQRQKGDKVFWSVAKELFDNQKQLDDATFEKIAKQHGLNLWRIKHVLKTQAHAKRIQEDQDLAGSLEARGTPSFFINGRRLSGAQPFARFKELVDEEMEKAKKLLKAGTPRHRIYAALQKDAKVPPFPFRVVKLPANINAGPAKGPRAAKVTVHIFSDFECPFCSRVLPTLEQLMQRFPKDVRLVWHNFPLAFHSRARPAANAALEAWRQRGDQAFWDMHDLLFKNQRELGDAKLTGYAKSLGVNVANFAQTLQGGHAASIDADIALGKTLGITGTPGFVINGYVVSGAQPLSAFERVVRRALSNAAKGVVPQPTP